MIIEFRHKESYLYLWIPGKEIDKIMSEKEGNKVIHIDFRTALQVGELLIPNRMRLEIVDSSQTIIPDHFRKGGPE